MSAVFSLTPLRGDRFAVKGTDRFGTEGETVVYAPQIRGLENDQKMAEAHEAFDAQVEKFFAPLIGAQDILAEAHMRQVDPLSVVVLDEGSEGVTAREAKLVELSHGAMVVRAIREGHADRLMWINGELEILEFEQKTATQAADDEVMAAMVNVVKDVMPGATVIAEDGEDGEDDES